MKEFMMNLTLWIIAGLLAVAYLVGGGGKLIMPKKIAAIAPSARWVEDFSAGSVKAIGALEVLAGVGLVLPAALDIAPVLVPLAAVGLSDGWWQLLRPSRSSRVPARTPPSSWPGTRTAIGASCRPRTRRRTTSL
jgi:DoxX-like protein